VPDRGLLPATAMRPLVLTAFIGMSSFLARATAQGGGPGQYTIAVDVDLVVFNVSVTDSKGRQVAGLKASDFRVLEKGRLQEIKSFSTNDVPASIGLIIDNSGSMMNKRDDVINAALVFLGASHPQDEMFAVNFNEKVYLGLPPSIPFTSERDQMRSALMKNAPLGLTALYDALAMGIEHLNGGTRDRKALVVLSDGGDNASRRSLNEVLEIAKRSNATIYTIGIYDETNLDRNPRVLRRISDLTGGKAYFPGSLKDMERVWRDIAGAIRGQYTLGYHSNNPGRDGLFRKVEITAGGRDRRVTTREGYFGPAAEPVAR
jgi:Ca-activated chloride channel family protein